jgi:Ser/Thr protein kinase RdoA (MazF antagonist)
MLLDDFGPVVGWDASPTTKVEVLTAFARIQREAASRHDELLELGVLDRRSGWLAAEIESLVDMAASLELEPGEAEELARLGPRLVEACDRLAAGPVPETLVHGDLHLSNVARGDGGYLFFDWTDACLTHPFLDLLIVLFEEDPDARLALSDAYLGEWAEHAPADELLELWRLAEPLASLNQAVSYRSILANVEPGTASELEPMTGRWLRRGLAAAAGWDDERAQAG